ncbi:MAG: hypothetical protein FWE70_06525, partial [Oscillospiraceae bacterium]|nr:hypothetical protein [Oscillospiraceae bacterium]
QALCRTTVPSQAAVPNQPKPSYYALRNIASIMDGYYAADFAMEASERDRLVAFTLRSGGGQRSMVCAWVDAPLSDGVTEVVTDFRFPGMKVSKAVIYDSFNGSSQEASVADAGEAAPGRSPNPSIPAVLVKDYPTYIEIHH